MQKRAIVVPHYNPRRFCDTQLPVTKAITETKKLNNGRNYLCSKILLEDKFSSIPENSSGLDLMVMLTIFLFCFSSLGDTKTSHNKNVFLLLALLS
ncbi:MAG TPA: hypothetical protein VMW72_18535 [Sedimentisphaerales bacterium]|nr:hypothetical protein [Sedimentisphaerales bacterium]